jgi:desumoylating isopeptidase 1
LPSDFLSTPFGAALRPTIDNMYRRAGTPTPPMAAAQASPNPALAASLLQSVASAAQQPSTANGTSSSVEVGASTVAAPLQISTNPSSFNSLLKSHRALVAFFTSKTCPPCRMIEPTFETIAHSKTHGRAGDSLPGFVKIDLGVGLGSQVASQYGVRATPTFIFFLNGKEVSNDFVRPYTFLIIMCRYINS